jgi:tetratricopeptide (TPR) repeat protein
MKPTAMAGRDRIGGKRVVPEASKRPVRVKPMRGPGADEVRASGAADGSAPATAAVLAPTDAAQQQAQMKEDFCAQLLLRGYVQSFVDLFYLTHRDGVASSDDPTPPPSSQLQPAEMEFLRDQLVAAEHCKRRGEIPEVLAAFDGLAVYCGEKGDVKTMIFFYDKCLEIARLVKDQVCEMRVLRHIGNGYHSIGDLPKAREYLEQNVALANVVYEHEDDEELRNQAHIEIGKVYVDLALRYERVRQFPDAIDFYKKYLDSSSKAKDADAVGHAQFKVGACYNALAQPNNALPFLEANVRACISYWDGCMITDAMCLMQLTTARATGNVEAEGNACAELALAHEVLGNKQVSIDFLNHYFTAATKAENIVSQADACARLGHIYTASQSFARAREMHEKNYELVPSVILRTGDRTAQNTARINVGAARANEKMRALLSLVNDDLQGLLEWKNARTIHTA